jgi:phenylacetic acid degradation operon negative regulatory protein
VADAPIELSTRVLVEGMIESDSTLDAGRLYRVAAACGMSEQQVRLCLRRMVAHGALVQAGRGRAARYRATRAGETLEFARTQVLPLAYAQDEGLAPWDHHWRLLSFTVPESQRPARDALRYQLRFLGWAAVDGGLYTTVHPSEDLVRDVARRHGIEQTLTFALCKELDVRGERDPPRLARTLWPLDELAAGYQAIRPLLRPPPRRTRSADELTARLFAIVTAVSRAIEFDPLLPAELRPPHWPGATVRRQLRAWLQAAIECEPALGNLAIAQTLPRELHKPADR